jgi:hypothetical protein
MCTDRLKLTGQLLVFVVLFGVILCVPSKAVVTFERTYGGSTYPEYASVGYSVQQTFGGGYVVAGMIHAGTPYQDAYLVRTDSLGDSLWAKSYGYGGNGMECAYTVEQGSGAGYLFAGGTSLDDPDSNGVWLVETDSLGDPLWEKIYGGDYSVGTCMLRTADGGYVIAGWGSSPSGGDSDVHLMKTDYAGKELWAYTYGGSDHDYGYSIEQTSDGGFLVVGSTSSNGAGKYDVYMIRTDSAGNLLWERTYGGPADDYGYSVEATRDGGYVIAGGTFSFGAGHEDVYLIGVDSLGNTIWTQTYGDWLLDEARSVHQTVGGAFVVTGGTWRPDSTSCDLFLLKTDSFGEKLWLRTYGGQYGGAGLDVKPTADGGYVAAGMKFEQRANGFYCDVYLIKTDAFGRVDGCQPLEPWLPESQGYWRRLCKDDSHEGICAYADGVHLLADLFDAYDCDSICELMGVRPPERDMCHKARRQFMALLLNVASGRLAVCNCIEDGREVGDAIAEIDSLLSGDPDFHTCEYAKTLADNLNNGIGIVPCDTFWAQAPPNVVQPPSISAAPNPFAKSTVIEYEVKVPGRVRLEIYDEAGRLVRTLVDAGHTIGSYRVEWDGLDSSTRRAPAGIYFTRLQTSGDVRSTKLILLR